MKRYACIVAIALTVGCSGLPSPGTLQAPSGTTPPAAVAPPPVAATSAPPPPALPAAPALPPSASAPETEYWGQQRPLTNGVYPLPTCNPGDATARNYAVPSFGPHASPYAWFCITPAYVWKRKDGTCYGFPDGFAKPGRDVPCSP